MSHPLRSFVCSTPLSLLLWIFVVFHCQAKASGLPYNVTNSTEEPYDWFWYYAEFGALCNTTIGPYCDPMKELSCNPYSQRCDCVPPKSYDYNYRYCMTPTCYEVCYNLPEYTCIDEVCTRCYIDGIYVCGIDLPQRGFSYFGIIVGGAGFGIVFLFLVFCVLRECGERRKVEQTPIAQYPPTIVTTIGLRTTKPMNEELPPSYSEAMVQQHTQIRAPPVNYHS